MTRYFEVYVAGSNGFSAYVKTDKIVHDVEEDVLNLAVKANVIEGGDAKEVFHGAGYVKETTLAELQSDGNDIGCNEI
jgi:hypothetical protein